MVQQKTKQKKEQTTTTSKPTFKGDGVAVWEYPTKEGRRYLNIKLIGHNTIKAFEQKD